MNFTVLNNSEDTAVTVRDGDIESSLAQYHHEQAGRALQRPSDFELAGPCVTINNCPVETAEPFPVGNTIFFVVADLPEESGVNGCFILRFNWNGHYQWELASRIIHTSDVEFTITPSEIPTLLRLTYE